MKKTIIILLNILLYSKIVFANEELTITITTIGSGNTFEIAKVSALRSALEQVSGAYLSSNTLIINDKLIADNITTITSGSIKIFEILQQNFALSLHHTA